MFHACRRQTFPINGEGAGLAVAAAAIKGSNIAELLPCSEAEPDVTPSINPDNGTIGEGHVVPGTAGRGS